jgi:hypothetical protein
MSEEKVSIKLSRAEALVLFELLSRFGETEKLQITELSEKKVLWDIQCFLEKTLTEPLQINYQELLESAREEVRAGE